SAPSVFSSLLSVVRSPHPPPAPATYTLSLHDALPIFARPHLEDRRVALDRLRLAVVLTGRHGHTGLGGLTHAARHELRAALVIADRKSTRLNSSHVKISYAVFCLKKKKI